MKSFSFFLMVVMGCVATGAMAHGLNAGQQSLHVEQKGQNAEQRRLNAEQQRLLGEMQTFLLTQNLAPMRTLSDALSFVSNGVSYLVEVSASEVYPMFVTLSSIYHLPSEYEESILVQTADRLNRYKGVKCLSDGQRLTFSAEWFLLDSAPFRYSFPKVKQQMEVMGADFQRLYAEIKGGIDSRYAIPVINGIPGQPHPLDSINLALRGEEGNGARSVSANALGLSVSTDTLDLAEENNPQEQAIVFDRPVVGSHDERRLSLDRVTLLPDCTMLDFTSYNNDGTTSYAWCSIQPTAYIRVDGVNYTLVEAERIAVSPKVTYYRSSNATLSFRLIFPAIPVETVRMDFADGEDSWWMRDIQLKK